MLHAILSGKAARVSLDGEDISWRELFRKREDLLTAAFFGRIPYLSEDARASLLAMLLGSKLSEGLGPFEGLEFWPRFALPDDGGCVEPDVWVCFRDATMLVEVKPPLGGDQYVQQWRNEIAGLLEERKRRSSTRDEIPEAAIFLALGRNTLETKAAAASIEADFGSDAVRIKLLEWEDVLEAVMSLEQQCSDPPTKAICADWIQALQMFGASIRRKPFRDLLSSGYGDDRSSFEAMRKWEVHPPEGRLASMTHWKVLHEFSCESILEMHKWKQSLSKMN